jgi:hypothetical protein
MDTGGRPSGVARDPDPVYNAFFAKADAAKEPIKSLFPRQQHLMHFWIGPQASESDLVGVKPNSEILNSRIPLNMRVVIACTFCESYRSSQFELTFDPALRQSNRIAFEFMPEALVTGAPVRSSIQVSVYEQATGTLYDRLNIPVTIAATGDSPRQPIFNRTLGDRRGAPSREQDLRITITEEQKVGLMVTIHPLSARARTSIGPLVLDERGLPRSFRTGSLAKEIGELGVTGFTRISAISVQGLLAQRLSRAGPIPVISPDSIQSGSLTPEEGQDVGQVVGNLGRNLYRILFCKQEEYALCRAMRAIDQYDAPESDPLRIAIDSDDLPLPWQYLHPSGQPIDGEHFWGIRYVLSVKRVADGTPETIALPAVQKTPGRIVFARYALATDPSVEPAMAQIEQLLKTPLPRERLLVVRSRKQLMEDAFRPAHLEIAGVIAFLHARAGAAIASTTEGLIVAPTAEGPQLEFAEKDAVSSDQLTDLYGATTGRYFASGPLVILNACESGPSGVAVQHTKMQDAFFRLGADGVIVTEVPVWIAMGHRMGTLLIDQLTKGASAEEALTFARRQLYRKDNNPLGLLYAYYGEPGLGLKF